MKVNQNLIIKIFALLILFSLAIPQDSLKEVFAQSDIAHSNRIYLDVTFDPASKTYSLIGLSDEQLKAFGAPELTDAIWNILARFESLSLAINNSQLNLNTNNLQLATIKWDEESRNLLYGLIDSYGMELSDQSKERLALWLDEADVVLNIRNSPSLSDPLVLRLDTLFMVDVTDQGKVVVEGFDTGFSLTSEVIDMVEVGGIEQAALCWSDGVVNTKINGATLPQFIVHQDGLEVINNALGLGLGDMTQYFGSQLGATVSFGGAEHDTIECGQ